jgi:hypothetical protein
MLQCNHCTGNLKVDYRADVANVVVADARWDNHFQSCTIVNNHFQSLFRLCELPIPRRSRGIFTEFGDRKNTRSFAGISCYALNAKLKMG